MKRILLVDDNREFLLVLSSVLRQYFEVFDADGVNKAIELLDTVTVDAICCDYNMQDGTGIDLLEKLRDNGVELPFLLMSAEDDWRLADQVKKYGASFCSKTDIDFIATIKDLIS